MKFSFFRVPYLAHGKHLVKEKTFLVPILNASYLLKISFIIVPRDSCLQTMYDDVIL